MVLRTRPTSAAARSDSREPPVGRPGPTTVADLSCCVIVPLIACHRHYPGGTDETQLRTASSTAAFPMVEVGRLPRLKFSGPARRSLALWPADSLNCQCSPLTPKALDRSLPPDRLRLLPGVQLPPGMGLAPTGTITPLHDALHRIC